MKFLHTSDWHIGRQLHNQSLLEDQKHVLKQLVEHAQQQQVDAIIVAGDIYDRSVPPSEAVALLSEVLSQLIQTLNIPVIMIAGNHDGHQRLAFAAQQMSSSGLHIIGPLSKDVQTVTLKSKSGEAIFYAIPYCDPATVRVIHDCEASTHQQAMEVLLKQVHEHDSQGLPKVVISHCFIDGGSESDSERPLSIGGADRISAELFTPFDYVALGHLHGPQFKGEKHVRYSGSLLKYSFSEQHQNKSVTLVCLHDDAPAQIELLPLSPLRDVRIVEGFLDDLISLGEIDAHSTDYLSVRLLDTHAILDAMGKLRRVYPNVLHLERTGLMNQSSNPVLLRDHIKKAEQDMFKDFFNQVSGEDMSDDQLSALQSTIDRLHKEEG
jgi:exonuclease SbcD